MSSVEKIHGAYNYIFLTDLYGPHFVLLESADECELSVDFEALMFKNGTKDSVKFLKAGSQQPCAISKDTYVLLRMEGLLELAEKNNSVMKSYAFDGGYSQLRISNHSAAAAINNSISAFNLIFSNGDSHITLDVILSFALIIAHMRSVEMTN